MVPSRDPVPPPELAGNDPVVNVFHPLGVGIFKTFRDEFNPVGRLLVGQGLFGQRLHLHEPLGRQPGFNLDPGPFRVPNGVDNWLFAQQVALVL